MCYTRPKSDARRPAGADRPCPAPPAQLLVEGSGARWPTPFCALSRLHGYRSGGADNAGCVHQIQMSPSLPFTDVTGVGRGALAQRSARLAARCTDAPEEQEAALVVLPSELTLAGL